MRSTMRVCAGQGKAEAELKKAKECVECGQGGGHLASQVFCKEETLSCLVPSGGGVWQLESKNNTRTSRSELRLMAPKGKWKGNLQASASFRHSTGGLP